MYCSKCGKEIAGNVTHCPHCGIPVALPYVQAVPAYAPQKSGCGKKILYGVGTLFALGIFGSIIGESEKAKSTGNNAAAAPEVQQTPVPAPMPSRFSGDCGISASAHLKSDEFINHPHLCISVKNVSAKNIAAIQFYAVPYDVYGKDLSSSLFSQKKLHTDDLIPAGGSKKLNYGPFIDQQMKSVKLYVYSVYFDDGSEWGDKDATRSEILKYGKQIEATFEK